MDMNYGYKHESVVHDLIASEVETSVEVAVVDDNVIVLVDNNIHSDYVNHPKFIKRNNIEIKKFW